MPAPILAPPLSAKSSPLAALLLLLSLAAFAPVIFGGTFFWDDHTLLLDNPFVHSSLFDIWFSTKNVDYIPLVSSTFWLEWKLWGAHAPPYHLLNALLHGGSGILLWQILRTRAIPGALLAAILFVIHPVNAESVAWIAERKNTLSLFLMLASLLAYLHGRQSRRTRLLIAAVALFLLALLSKGAVVMLPFALLILAWHQHRRITRADLAHTIPYFALSLAMGLVTLYFQLHNSIAGEIVRTDSFPSRLATAGCAVWFYLFRLFLPLHIVFTYPRWDVLTNHGPWAFLPLAALVAIFLILFQFRRTPARHLLAALSIYVVMLLPTLGFINIFYMRYSLVSDHWQYQATPAMFAWIAASALWLYHHLPARARILSTGAAACLGLALFTYTIYIATIYRTPESIWQNTLAYDPDSWLANDQMGAISAAYQHYPDAIAYYSKLVRLYPQRPLAYINLGAAFTATGDTARAIDLLNHALALPNATNEEKARAYQSLGILYGKLNTLDRAEACFAQAYSLDPESYTINYYLGLTYFNEHKLDLARPPLQRAANIRPEDIRSRLFLAQLDLQQGRFDQAAATAREILTLDPKNPDALAILYPSTSTTRSTTFPATTP